MAWILVIANWDWDHQRDIDLVAWNSETNMMVTTLIDAANVALIVEIGQTIF
jgi:hypothetical protein